MPASARPPTASPEPIPKTEKARPAAAPAPSHSEQDGQYRGGPGRSLRPSHYEPVADRAVQVNAGIHVRSPGCCWRGLPDVHGCLGASRGQVWSWCCGSPVLLAGDASDSARRSAAVSAVCEAYAADTGLPVRLPVVVSPVKSWLCAVVAVTSAVSDLLIRRHGQVVQDRPGVTMTSGGILYLWLVVVCCRPHWQQVWQQ